MRAADTAADSKQTNDEAVNLSELSCSPARTIVAALPHALAAREESIAATAEVRAETRELSARANTTLQAAAADSARARGAQPAPGRCAAGCESAA
jgi:hypothetical protein